MAGRTEPGSARSPLGGARLLDRAALVRFVPAAGFRGTGALFLQGMGRDGRNGWDNGEHARRHGVRPGVGDGVRDGGKQSPRPVSGPGASVSGARQRGTNLDCSRHVEEVVDWRPADRVRLRLAEFPPPLGRLSTGLLEIREFRPGEPGTRVTRSFELTPKTRLTRPTLWLGSIFWWRAVARHLSEVLGPAAKAEED
jgi:hypothetical protein